VHDQQLFYVSIYYKGSMDCSFMHMLPYLVA
jgi:hypothetical protein